MNTLTEKRHALPRMNALVEGAPNMRAFAYARRYQVSARGHDTVGHGQETHGQIE